MRKRFIVLAAFVLALLVAGCGSSSSNSSSSSSSSSSGSSSANAANNSATTAPAGAKKGGHLDVLSASDVDSLDPGYWYYQYDYMALEQPTQRALYSWEADKTTPTPDIATGPPVYSDGNKTITIHIRPGIKYSPGPVTRTVKADDFVYAMQRCFLPQVGNGYVNSYFGDLVGADAFKNGKAKSITGLSAPNDTTFVMKFTRPA